MRRTDREVKGYEAIIDILNRCNTIRLGINGSEYPYVVPLSFGFETVNKKITFYIHGAQEGLKHDLIAKNNKVCVEASIFHGFAELPQQNALTTEYESVIGFGKAEIVGGSEAVKGLNLICEHAGFKNFEYGGKKALNVTRVYKIEIEKFTGKRRFV